MLPIEAAHRVGIEQVRHTVQFRSPWSLEPLPERQAEPSFPSRRGQAERAAELAAAHGMGERGLDERMIEEYWPDLDPVGHAEHVAVAEQLRP